jgi:hypothetical protein
MTSATRSFSWRSFSTAYIAGARCVLAWLRWLVAHLPFHRLQV